MVPLALNMMTILLTGVSQSMEKASERVQISRKCWDNDGRKRHVTSDTQSQTFGVPVQLPWNY